LGLEASWHLPKSQDHGIIVVLGEVEAIVDDRCVRGRPTRINYIVGAYVHRRRFEQTTLVRWRAVHSAIACAVPRSSTN
jgi:hypothetical protein